MRKKWIAGLLAISMIAAMGGCSGARTSNSYKKAKESSAGENYGAERSDPVYGSCYGHRRNAVADS